MISLGYSVFLEITKISGTKEKPGTWTKEKPGTEPNSNTIIHAWFECMAASPPMSTVGGLQGILSCMLFRNTVYGVWCMFMYNNNCYFYLNPNVNVNGKSVC